VYAESRMKPNFMTQERPQSQRTAEWSPH